MANSKISAFSEPTAPALTDVVAAVQSSTNYKEQLKNLLGLLPVSPGGRLTLTTGVPVTTADVTGATSVLYTPYLHNGIQLWDGNQWQLVAFSEKTLALGTLTSGKPYDVFGFLSAGDLSLESLVWTNDTTRATAVTFQDGRLCKSGDKTRLLLGTFYTTATTTTEDSLAKRYLANVYNTVTRPMQSALETANTWTYNSTTVRQANGNTANQLDYVVSYTGPAFAAVYFMLQGGTNKNGTNGIGYDVTNAFSSMVKAYVVNQLTSVQFPGTVTHQVISDAGRHFLAWVESAESGNTITSVGDQNAPTFVQCGITGWVTN